MEWLNSIAPIDFIVLVLYFLFILLIGFRYRKSSDAENYFLAGRSMKWPVIGFSMFAASISSSTLIGHSGDAYATGIAVFNYNLVSTVVMLVFAWFFLPFYIKNRIFTIPEFLGNRFSSASRYYFSVITIIVNIFLDAAGALYAAALVMQMLFPEMSLLSLSLIFAVIVAAYTIPGGLSSAIRVDLIQGIVLLVGAVVLTMVISARGGMEYVIEQWNGNSMMMKLLRPLDDTSVPWLGMLVGIPVLGFFFWGNNQQLVQRALTAKNVDEARKGVVFVGLLTVLTLFIIIIPGVMARKFFPELASVDMVYPSLVMKMLPVGVVGFLLAALIAALTSSLSGLLTSVATLVTMDFYVKFRPESSSRDKVLVGRIASFAALFIAVLWAPQIGAKFGSLLKYYQEMLSVIAPPVVAAFFLGVFWKRINSSGAFAGLMAGAALGIVNLVVKFITGVSIFGPIHFLLTVPFYFLFSMAVMIAVSYLTPAPNYTSIENYIWSRRLFRQETVELRSVAWYSNYRVWTYLLLGLCAVVLFVFA